MRLNKKNAFWTSEVATMLDVQPITVRAWALKFEEKGFDFPRDVDLLTMAKARGFQLSLVGFPASLKLALTRGLLTSWSYGFSTG